MKIYLNAYLEKNLGDDLFLYTIIERYPNHKFVSISKNQKYRMKNLKVYSNPYLFRFLKKFSKENIIANKCDLVVSIGGSMYIENNDSNRNFSLGKNKYFVLGSNFGPYKTKKYFENLKGFFSKAEDVCFREEYSYNLFKDLNNVRYAQDVVFSMDISRFKAESSGNKAIISVIDCSRKIGREYQEKYEDKIIEIIKHLKRKQYNVCLMSFCKEEKDEEAINRILVKYDGDVDTYFYDGNIDEALKEISSAKVIFGSRFHANILGLLFGKSIIPIIYSDKTLHSLEDMKINPKIVDIRNLDEFDVECLNDYELTRKFSVSREIKSSEEQFLKLDQILKEK